MAEKKKQPAKKQPEKKQPEKKQPAKKTPAKKAVPKKAAPKKSVPKKPEPPKVPEKKPLLRRRTIAERTVAWKTGRTGHILRWLAIPPLVLLMVFFTFFMAGYSFTVLVCGGLVGILLFYNITDLLLKKYPKPTRTVRRIISTLLVIGLLVVAATECLIIHASFGDPKESVDYVVVLGAKVRPDGPSVSLMDRVYGARDYLREHPGVIAVVSGGQGPDEPMTEAKCMYEQLTKLGIDPDRIWLEDKATSTWENMQFALDLIERKTGSRPEKLGVVSSEYHLFRAGLFADACGVEAVGIPARTSRISQMVNHFMREVAGVWHYLLLGGNYQ